MKEIVVVGEEMLGKTTLCNALLGWDILPQSCNGTYMETKENTSRNLTEELLLTDTPGYDLWNEEVPGSVVEAASRADKVVMLLTGLATEEEIAEAVYDPRWQQAQIAEARLLKDLLAHTKTRDIYFVIPFYTRTLYLELEERFKDLRLVRERYAPLSDHGGAGVFLIDPMKALLGTIEDDEEAVAQSGILPLKAALLGER